MIKWLKWEDLTEVEKEQAIESYMFFRAEEEGTPCSRTRKRAEKGVVCCKFKRQNDGYVYVNI